ncbi:MAG: helicase [Bacteroidetes bacterium GWF2_43_63]|nr:MAG: helicase [Bacteroidetes bacterium GWE2_42_42]OFY56014.1 MAG: helicase [Bacteroidetes bacterium GWF2_43_63]HBG70743.1 helicase [Bacteroidales bacterium]HCB62429.1 helicase [Bacteroidales bacterium]HCY21884.1 helicase [Bacteroidales bacterium]
MTHTTNIISAAIENLHIEKLNAMQVEAIDSIEKNQDTVLLAPTGSGKTIGFLLPILKLLDANKDQIQALVLTPSRELAIQIEQVFKSMKTGFRSLCCYGGHSVSTEKKSLQANPALLIGTPGRIADHIRRGHINTTGIHTLVLDEFDKSLEFGFEREMRFIIELLEKLQKRILTSATHSLAIPDFTGMQNPVELNYLTAEAAEGLTLKVVMSDSLEKTDTLFRLLCHLGNHSTMVFCNHREAVERISRFLADRQLENDIFHGGLEQDERERVLIKFHNGSVRILITTDLASRGLDIPLVENIIHYQLPSTETAFTHRNGRTARMHAQGNAFLLLAGEEKLPVYINEKPPIEPLPEETVVPKPSDWQTIYISAGKKDKVNKVDIVGLLLQKGKLKKEELGLINVLDFVSFAAVKSNKVPELLRLLRDEPLKKKKVKIAVAR